MRSHQDTSGNNNNDETRKVTDNNATEFSAKYVQ